MNLHPPVDFACSQLWGRKGGVASHFPQPYSNIKWISRDRFHFYCVRVGFGLSLDRSGVESLLWC